jgi:hypothetical protein
MNMSLLTFHSHKHLTSADGSCWKGGELSSPLRYPPFDFDSKPNLTSKVKPLLVIRQKVFRCQVNYPNVLSSRANCKSGPSASHKTIFEFRPSKKHPRSQAKCSCEMPPFLHIACSKITINIQSQVLYQA